MKGSEVGVGLVMETHDIEGVRAKGIPRFERLGKRRGIFISKFKTFLSNDIISLPMQVMVTAGSELLQGYH